jgi:hypothetical protein
MLPEASTTKLPEPAIAPDRVAMLVPEAAPVLDAMARLLARQVVAEIATKSASQEPSP